MGLARDQRDYNRTVLVITFITYYVIAKYIKYIL